MAIVEDLRGNAISAESNAHTEILEEIIKNATQHKTTTKIKNAASQIYDLLQLAGAGYLAGYVTSGGDHATATKFAEYSTVLWATFKLGVELPSKKLLKKTQKGIEEKVTQEAKKAKLLEEIGQFHTYEPKQGVDFTNHDANYDNRIKKQIQIKYWGNLEGAKKPIRRTLHNAFLGAISVWFASLLVDTEVNIIDLVGPNPIEKGLELTHYLIGKLEPIKDYVSLNAHEHVGDFNQIDMLYVGAAAGVLATAREFIQGNYQRIRAKFKKSS